MKNIIEKIFISKKGIRILWLVIIVITLIFLGEILIVDTSVKLLTNLGLSEVKNTVAKTWSSALGDSTKRILRSAVIGFSVLFVLRYFLKKKASFIGLDFHRDIFKEILFGIGLGFIVQIVSIILMVFFGWFHFTGFSWEYNSISFFAPAIFYSIIFCIETGIIEEVIFRGFLLNIFEERYTTIIGVTVSSVLFGLIHFSGFDGEFAWWMSIISSLTIGILFAQAFLLYRSLWLPIALHAGWHFAMRFLGSVGLNSDEAIFLVTKVEGPEILVSTKAGGAGLFELIGVIVVSLLLFSLNNISKRRKKIQ
jgi:membrane protease YdiL (CAAX protease family)